MTKIDPSLDDREKLVELYKTAGRDTPKRPKLAWHFHNLDFGLIDRTSGVFVRIREGWT
jgi:hypothetical protein